MKMTLCIPIPSEMGDMKKAQKDVDSVSKQLDRLLQFGSAAAKASTRSATKAEFIRSLCTRVHLRRIAAAEFAVAMMTQPGRALELSRTDFARVAAGDEAGVCLEILRDTPAAFVADELRSHLTRRLRALVSEVDGSSSPTTNLMARARLRAVSELLEALEGARF